MPAQVVPSGTEAVDILLFSNSEAVEYEMESDGSDAAVVHIPVAEGSSIRLPKALLHEAENVRLGRLFRLPLMSLLLFFPRCFVPCCQGAEPLPLLTLIWPYFRGRMSLSSWTIGTAESYRWVLFKLAVEKRRRFWSR